MIVEQTIRQRLEAAFQPRHLEVVNESHQHSVPANSETHFKVVLVSDAFDGRRKVARHQQVYAQLSEELAGPVHALALHTYTPGEWEERNAAAPDSPDCLGGSKREQRESGNG